MEGQSCAPMYPHANIVNMKVRSNLAMLGSFDFGEVVYMNVIGIKMDDGRVVCGRYAHSTQSTNTSCLYILSVDTVREK